MFLPGQETPVKTDSDPLPPPSTAFPVALGQTSENKLPAMNQLFSHGCPTKALGDYTRINNVINSMLSGPTLDNQRKKKDTSEVYLKFLLGVVN